LLWLVDTYATADCEAECDRCPQIDSHCKPDPSTHAESFGHSELVAHYHADTNANADDNTDDNTNTNTNTNIYSHNVADADPYADPDAGCNHAFRKRRATRDRWIDDQSSHKRFTVQRATRADSDAFVHCRRQ
jgi:hypothetical protein